MSPYRIVMRPAACRHVWVWHVIAWRWDEWVPERVGWSCERCATACPTLRSVWLTFLLGLRHPEWWR